MCGPSSSATGMVVSASTAMAMQGRRHAGEVADDAEHQRRGGAGGAAQRVEEAEAAALAVVAHELGDRAVEHRRCAVERDADRDQQDHAHAQRCHHQRGDQYAGGKLGQDHRAQDADALGKEAAHELARRAADEHQGKAEADARNAGALGHEQEREEGEKAGAAGAVDELDGAEQRKARSDR